MTLTYLAHVQVLCTYRYYLGSEWNQTWQWHVTYLNQHSSFPSFLQLHSMFNPLTTFTMQVVEDLATVRPGSLSSWHTFDLPASDVKCSCSTTSKDGDPDVACNILVWCHVSLLIWVIALSTSTKVSMKKKVKLPVALALDSHSLSTLSMLTSTLAFSQSQASTRPF